MPAPILGNDKNNLFFKNYLPRKSRRHEIVIFTSGDNTEAKQRADTPDVSVPVPAKRSGRARPFGTNCQRNLPARAIASAPLRSIRP